MENEIKGCFLRTNSKEIQERLKEIGLSICTCVEFPESVWLVCHKTTMTYDIHGVGYEEDGSIKLSLENFLKAHKEDLIDCGMKDGYFIKLAKNMKGK